MSQLTIKSETKTEVRFLLAECGVRYWEDASVNGSEDEDGTLIPFRNGETWKPLIDLETGVVVGWPQGTTADIHYKVCDDGAYKLLSGDHTLVASIDGYVPKIMSPGGAGYGDYVIMKIDGEGRIEGWNPDLTPWEDAA